MDKTRDLQSNQTGWRRDAVRLKKVEFLSSTCIATSAALLMAVAVPSGGWAATPASYVPCSSAPTPPPTTTTDLFTALLGQDGKGGASSSFEGPGHAGDPGEPGGDATFTSATALNSISFFSLGGNGGEGSNAGTGDPAGPNGGGVGVKGGDGGTLNLTIANPVTQGDEGSLFSTVCAFSGGGTGGKAGLSQDHGPKHPSGPGGAGGSITVTNNSTISSQQGAGVMAWATAGDGADGKTNGNPGTLNGGSGGDAGAGGSSQVITVTNSGTITSYTAGVLATNIGGNGGNGGDAYSDGTIYHGGAGGDGGTGGIITVNNSGSITTLSDGSAGIWTQAFGGLGGAGGGVGSGGKGGVGGIGGGIAITLGGTIATTGQDAPGVLAQSFGGQGAPGGSGVAGGAGGTGGDGGVVVIQGGGTVNTGSSDSPQTNSQGILAQAIGGGGGNGGNATVVGGWSEIGGSGGVSAKGGDVTINTGTSITTYGERSQAVVAQSIGGGGGNGGNATGKGTFYNLAIGGSGAGGGDGQTVLAQNTGTLATNGLHATGMLLQSVGGGGGSGGAAISSISPVLVGVAVATGGTGSSGGTGGAIGQISSGGTTYPTNGGVILTSSAESTGILGQSIGGGGGKGGPAGTGGGTFYGGTSLDILLSHGGRGGGGGWGGTVSLENGGMILTSGAGSRGLHGQSIGGGGGDGGDASTISPAYLTKWPLTIAHNVGGSGGVVGSGNTISLLNSALIVTIGADADAMLGQSIGGGGGTTGSGDGYSINDITVNTTAGATAGNDPNGTGATGGHGDGGVVTLTNSNDGAGGGSIITLGDGAAGMLAQSIGGGGGRIGGMAGQAENFSVTTVLGMSSGGGGSGATDGSTRPVVNVTNYGQVLTFGADAPGIVAQSIGGGGGLAGKGATTIGYAKSTGDGGNGVDTAWTRLSRIANAGTGTLGNYTSVQDVISLANSLVGNQTNTSLEYVQQLADMAASQGTAAPPAAVGSIDINLTLGASSSATSQDGGSGGLIQVTNTGSLITTGKMSMGAVAQSIGGGGGIAGVANTAYSSGESNASITLGGSGASVGNGGNVNVTNTASGTIMTISSLAPGIVAQSIGGGGGVASLSGDSKALLPALEIELGNQGAYGASSDVTVDNESWVATLSHDAPAIIAQSIGGGGGLVRVLATDQETGSGQIFDGGSATYNLTIGGDCGVNCGGGYSTNAANVSVTNSDLITTNGNGSHGVLAQSIGGGGGAVLGGLPSGIDFFGTGPFLGDAGNVTVVAGNADGSEGGSIYTTGDGAVAVLAQAIGGGGGLAGNLALTSQRSSFTQQTGAANGRAGDVSITAYAGATLQTSGANAPVILAQSIGGGGGLIANRAAGGFSGSRGGEGPGGNVTVNVYGQVIANGTGSSGIYAESSDAQGLGSPMKITVYSGGKVQGGSDAVAGNSTGAGIYFVGGGPDADFPNVVTVQSGGTLTSLAGTSGTAVYSSAGYTEVLNSGTISGNILLTNNGGAGCFTNNGTYNAGNQVVVSPSCDITNAGTINIGSAGAIERTSIRGNFVQGLDGVLNIDADFKNGQSDKLEIDGRAVVAGTLNIQPVTISNRAVTVLSATSGVEVDPKFVQTDGLTLFNFPVSVLGNELKVTPEATFSGAATGFGQNRQALGDHLQRLWDSGVAFDGYTALASIADDSGYRQALETANGETLGAIAALRFAASRNFVTDIYGCPKDGVASVVSAEGSCLWARAFGNSTKQGATTNALGYDMTSTMLQVGGQWQFAPNWFAGASLAYETSRLEGDHDVATIDGDNVLAGAALTYQSGGWLLSGAVDGGYGWYDSRRNIVVGSFSDVAEASPTAWHVGFHGRAAYEMALGGWYVTPSASVHAIYAHGNAFTETGASPFNLTVEEQDGFALTAAAAVEVGTRIDLGAYGVLRPFLGAGVSFTTANDWTTKARFTSLPGVADRFSTASPVPDVLGKLTAGVELAGSSSWDIRLQYDAEMGQDYLSHTGVARLSVHF